MNQDTLLKSIRLYLFDMDGTLYLGNRLYDFTLELLDTIKSTGRRYLFMKDLILILRVSVLNPKT